MTLRLHSLALAALLFVAGTVAAQEADDQGGAAPNSAVKQADGAAADGGLEGSALSIGPTRVAKLLMRGDPSMWGLVLCSIITITFALERLIVLRSSRVMPRTFVDRFMDRL